MLSAGLGLESELVVVGVAADRGAKEGYLGCWEHGWERGEDWAYGYGWVFGGRVCVVESCGAVRKGVGERERWGVEGRRMMRF